MSAFRILVVDDEAGIRTLLSRVLRKQDYQVEEAEDGEGALLRARQSEPHLVLLDLKMPGIDGLEVMAQLRAEGRAMPVIMLTAHSTVETAVEAMKLGAYDYLRKPFDVEDLLATVRRALSVVELQREVVELRAEVDGRFALDRIVGQDAKVLAVCETIRTVAPQKSTVLVTGESGTGKELIARALHHLSPRAHRRFVKVNCAAISEELLESELFGHEKGSFTGALKTTEGKFELADGGTILLDEISEMSPKLQAKLLRVIQEKEIDRVGGREPIPVDVRVVATTNRHLPTEVEAGRFRADLYYRRNVVQLSFLPARAPGDIPPWPSIFWRVCGRDGQARVRHGARLHGAPRALRLAGQCARAGERDRAAVVLTRNAVLQPEDLPAELERTSRARRARGASRHDPWRRCRAGVDPAHAGSRRWQPHPRGGDAGDFHSHHPQQAGAIPGRGRAGSRRTRRGRLGERS
ncbi:sigma 54-interacting transcriptional regulator [bacterium]|nr:sigma 54-interacting transcriptional regulator [bacterium]